VALLRISIHDIGRLAVPTVCWILLHPRWKGAWNVVVAIASIWKHVETPTPDALTSEEL
jgi:hypothetical protein